MERAMRMQLTVPCVVLLALLLATQARETIDPALGLPPPSPSPPPQPYSIPPPPDASISSPPALPGQELMLPPPAVLPAWIQDTSAVRRGPIPPPITPWNFTRLHAPSPPPGTPPEYAQDINPEAAASNSRG